MLDRLGERVFPTLIEPLRSRSDFERLVGDDHVWRALFEQPLSELLEAAFGDDLTRGIALTDATIGTFAPADDPELRQNRCFLYHVNEGYEQLQRAHEEAAAGAIPTVPPCELYCHTLTDPSILSPELRAAGAHTVTLFGLHMPARLFRADPKGAKRAAVDATLRS